MAAPFLQILTLARIFYEDSDLGRYSFTHATVSDNFYGKWVSSALAQLRGLKSDIILCAHSHVPSITETAGKLIVNPGSIGQSRSGRPVASYAIWQDGKLELRECEYPVEKTIEAINRLDYEPGIKQELAQILETGIVR